jgi:crotonobetainyl-CoA:carnitine CoA-transferase CaiB-like acyl-CoA transferase
MSGFRCAVGSQSVVTTQILSLRAIDGAFDYKERLVMSGPLEGIKVVDFANHAVGPGAGALLGALGADVIKVEPPKGDPLREILPFKSGFPTTSTVVNLNKRSIVLDLKNPADHEVAVKIASQADVLVENFRAGVMDRLGLGYEVVSELNPRIVYCSSGSFGARGPMARVGSTDPQGQAFGGYASLNGPPGAKAEVSRNMAYIDSVGSNFLVQGALTALLARERTGRGQHVLGSQMHWVIAIQTSRLGHYFATGQSPRPMGTAVPHIVPSQAFQSRDRRWIFLSAVTPGQWRGLCEALRHTEWADDERFASNAARVANRAELVSLLESAIADREGSWWLEVLTDHGVPCATAMEYEDHLYHEHFRANKALINVPLTDGTALLVPSPPWQFSSSSVRMEPAPQPGQHNDEIRQAVQAGDPWARVGSEIKGPQPEQHRPAERRPEAQGAFDGLTVIDMSQGISGPFASLCLADFGADVIKVEPPAGDYSRQLGPPFGGSNSALFMMLNRNKRSIALDCEVPAELDILRALVARADVFIDDLPSGRRAELGLDYESLRQLNPRLVHCSISSLGEQGPWAGKAVSELELQALSGATHFLGRDGEAPERLGADACSMVAGQAAFQAIGAALYCRDRTGEGQHADVSEFQATFSTASIMQASFDHPDDWAGHHCRARGNDPDYGYETADEPLYFGNSYQSDQPWIDLCHILGMEDLLDDPNWARRQQRAVNAAALKPLLEQHFRHFSSEYLLKTINETGNIAVPVNDHEALFEHEQVLANDRVLAMTLQNGDQMRMPGIPWEMSLTPGSTRLPPPLLDEHRQSLLRDIAGSETSRRKLA